MAVESPRHLTTRLKGLPAPAAVQLVGDFKRRNLQVNVFHLSALLGSCEKSGQWALALEILAQERGMEPDVFCYMPALRACRGRWAQALELFHSMDALGTKPDLICYSGMIGTASQLSQWQVSLQLLDDMCGRSLTPSPMIAGMAMTSCQEAGQWRQVLTLLQDMPRLGLVPDLICYNIAISSCESVGTWRIALKSLEEILHQSLQLNTMTLSATITACARALEWQAACTLFWGMKAWSLAPDVISYNAALAALSQHWQLAMLLLARSATPDIITYNCAITACEKGGQWQLALNLLEVIKERFLEPNLITYQSVLSSCEREAQWQAALAVLKEVIAIGPPTGMQAGSVLHAIQLAQGEPRAMELLKDLLPLWPCGEMLDLNVLATAPGVIVALKPAGVSTEDFTEELQALTKAPLRTVSRLDFPTSGCLPLAVGSEHALQAQFAGRLVHKEPLRRVVELFCRASTCRSWVPAT